MSLNRVISIKAIVFGVLIAAIGNLAAGIFFGFTMAVVGGLIMSMILGFGFTFFGGFIAGRIAKQSQVLHGGIVGAIGLSVVFFFPMSLHLWFILRIVGLIPIGMGGGYFARDRL